MASDLWCLAEQRALKSLKTVHSSHTAVMSKQKDLSAIGVCEPGYTPPQAAGQDRSNMVCTVALRRQMQMDGEMER